MAPNADRRRGCCRSKCRRRQQPVDYIYEQPPAELLGSLLPRYVEIADLSRAAGIGRGRTRRAHDGDGSGHLERRRRDREADAVHEPRAPGQHHQGNYRSGQRRGRAGVEAFIWQRSAMNVIGKVIQVAGPAVDCEFPEGQIPWYPHRDPHHQRRLQRSRPDRHHLRSGAAHRRRPRAHHRAAAHRRPGARHEGRSSLGEPVTVPVGKETLGRVLNVIGEPVDKMGPVNTAKRISDSPPGAGVRRAVDRARRCSRPASRSSICSSLTCAAARSDCSAARASARPSSFRS